MSHFSLDDRWVGGYVAGGVGTEEVLTERVAVPNPEGARTCERPSASEDLCMRGARAAGGVGTEEVLTA